MKNGPVRLALFAGILALLVAPITFGGVHVIEHVVVVPGDDISEVTFVIVPLADSLLEAFYMDPGMTCVPEDSVPPDCDDQTLSPEFEISAIRIGGAFWKTGNAAYDTGSKSVARSLFDDWALPDAKPPVPLPAGTPFSVTFRTDNDPLKNPVRIKILAGVTSDVAPYSTTIAGPVNP